MKKKYSSKSNKFVKEFLNQIHENNTDALLENFDVFENSKDFFEDGKKFLISFLIEINTHYGLNLTIMDACQLVKENIHLLNMSIEMQSVVLNIIELYGSNKPSDFQYQKLECSAMIATGIYWPWEWGYISLIKKQIIYSFKQAADGFMSFFKPALFEVKEVELPSDIYVGGAELLAGALCMIVATVIPPFYAVGTVLLGDGANRVCNGISQLGEERRNHSNDSSFSDRLNKDFCQSVPPHFQIYRK